MTRAGVWACLFLLGIHGIHIGDRALGGRGRGDGVVCVLQCMERFHGPSCQDRESQKQARPNSRSTSPRRRLRRVSLHDMAREPQGVYIPHFYLHDMQWLLLTFFSCVLYFFSLFFIEDLRSKNKKRFRKVSFNDMHCGMCVFESPSEKSAASCGLWRTWRRSCIPTYYLPQWTLLAVAL